MKILHIKAEYKTSLEVLKKVKIKGKFGILTTIQHLNQVKKIKLKNSIFLGQMLGCYIPKKTKLASYLYIGTGKFHPIEIALETKKPVYIANPLTNKFYKLDQKEIINYQKKLKGKLAKFYSAKKIGIIVSLKPGQLNLKQAENFQKKLKKESFIFLTNNINEEELENFPDINFWVNTACPRIEIKNVINLRDIPKI